MNQYKKLEDVFKTSGIPDYTFVKPKEWNELLLALRTKGRGVIVEGPSGIGKTTSILKAIEELKIENDVIKLTARKEEDKKFITGLPTMGKIGMVIIDDFHLLDKQLKTSIADYLKVLADEEDENSKLLLIGINKAGDSLIKLAPDLNNRISTIKYEANPENKIRELIEKGEGALKISIKSKKEIVENAHGSFHITQLLCQKICTLEDFLEEKDEEFLINSSFSMVNEIVVEELGRIYGELTKKFAIGSKLRREGRAPYLRLLYWLSKSDNWTIQIDNQLRECPEYKGSVGQIVDKGYLMKLINDDEDIGKVLYYDDSSKILSVNDPKYFYYLKNIMWSKFSTEIGYIKHGFESKYDFALSFAGEKREIAEKLYRYLSEKELEVFYDKNEQHRMLAEDIEAYLAPIYRTEADYVIVFLSKEYPKRIWTKFESDNFKERFGNASVIPVWFSDVDYSDLFDMTKKIGGLTLDVTKEEGEEIKRIGKELIKKLTDHRKYLERGSQEYLP